MNNSLMLDMFFIIPIIFGAVSFIVFIIIVISIVANIRKRLQIYKNLENIGNENQKPINNIFDLADSINNNTCEYCGTKYSRKYTKCPNCGANKK